MAHWTLPTKPLCLDVHLVGSIQKRLAHKIYNDITMAQIVLLVINEWKEFSGFVFDIAIVEQNGFPRILERLVQKTIVSRKAFLGHSVK